MNGLNIIGRRFTRLIVAEFAYNNNKKNYWKCKCDCGKEKIIQTQSLIDGRTKSCGCIHKKELEGKRFGMLLVVELSRKTSKSQHARYWKCKCDCGNTKDINQTRLTCGKTTSCGCNHFRTGKFHAQWKGCGEFSGTFFNTIKNGAKLRGLDFSITQEEIWELFLKQERKCALTGLDLCFSKLSGKKDGTASLDRIDSSKGYTIDNVWWVHKDVNIMKMAFTLDQFRFYCKRVSEIAEQEYSSKMT